MTNRDPQPLAASRPAAAMGLRPWLLGGMSALLVARPLFPSESAAKFGDGLPIVMLWIALAVFWLLGATGRPRFSIRFGATDVAVLALVAWHTLAAVWAVGHGSPRPALNMLWEWAGMGLCFVLVRQLVATAREARALVLVMASLAAGVSAYGLYQVGVELPRTRALYAADPEHALAENDLSSRERTSFEARLGNRTPLATFVLTNSLAAFLAPWLVALGGMAIEARAHRRRLAAILACAIPIAVCLALTKSRSGYLGVGAGLATAWWWSRRGRVRAAWRGPAIGAAVAAAIVVAAFALRGDLYALAAKSFGFRLHYWRASLRMIGDHPLLGCGPGNFQNAYTRYKLPEATEEIADPHNFLLEVAATAGVPAAVAILGVLACFGLAMWRRGRRDGGGEVDGSGAADGSRFVVAGGVGGVLLSLPVGALSEAPPGFAPVLVGLPMAAVAAALLWGWMREGAMPWWLPAAAIVALLVALSATGGIGLPSVACTFWALLALGLGKQGEREATAWVGSAGLFAALGLAIACYLTAYAPVLAAQTALRKSKRDLTHAVEHLNAAAAADPYSGEPWRRLAMIEVEACRRHPDERNFERFEQACNRLVALEPNSEPAWSLVGDGYMRALDAATGRHKQIAERATAAYQHAVKLYPTSPLCRADLAMAYRAAGDERGFRREADAALRSDDALPDGGKKLSSERRQELLRALSP